MRYHALLVALGLLASACARPPKPLRGTFADITPADAHAKGAIGERVRWGGQIVSTKPGRDETCFEIVSKALEGEARPMNTDETLGRFIACAPGFYDPAIYAPGREVTVTGTLAEPTSHQVGEYEYRYAKVKAETVYLWPRPRERVVYYDPWGDPFWDPYWGWGVGGVVAVPVVPEHEHHPPPVRHPHR